ncbi:MULTISPECIES: DUF4266 domain-containing protein [Cellvibrio]|jgi:hypothetical protein|uniref:DUF4266 domain-containing protein n=1 Tax=Cellvibrio fibrivorans TaxID=126350 RepID=A0ABU1USU5_9GAMM|nr:DUF4266 domain-containing protein [Cellvibrio fibrivorans]MDR7088253.1 hypothetical protein [Cellvibrio fibrivorans]
MILRRLLFIVLLFSIAACSPIKPWVKPYERQKIADEIMSFERNPIADSYLHHVYDAREAARGGDGASGGGCGCN